MSNRNGLLPKQEEILQHWGYVYKITNQITGRIYIGIHAADNKAWGDYQGSGTYLKQEQRSYGLLNFKKEFVEWVESEPQAVIAEAKHITNALRGGLCYNSNNAYSTEPMEPFAHFEAFAFKASFRPMKRLNSLVNALLKEQQLAETFEQKQYLQRSVNAHLLAIQLKKLRYKTTGTKDLKP